MTWSTSYIMNTEQTQENIFMYIDQSVNIGITLWLKFQRFDKIYGKCPVKDVTFSGMGKNNTWTVYLWQWLRDTVLLYGCEKFSQSSKKERHSLSYLGETW